MASELRGVPGEEMAVLNLPAPAAPQSRMELPYLRAVMVNYNTQDLTAEKCTLVFKKIAGTPPFTPQEISRCQELRSVLEAYHIATLEKGLATDFLPEAKVYQATLRAFRAQNQDIVIENLKTDHV